MSSDSGANFAFGRHSTGRARRAAAALLVYALLGASAPPADPLSIVIKPEVGPDGKVTGFRVSERLAGRTKDGRPMSFKAVLEVVTVKHIADSVTDLILADADGNLPTSMHDDPLSKPFPARIWRVARRPVGAINLSYRIPLQNGALRGGPPFGTATAGKGVAGSGLGLLIVPENLKADRTRITWDLSAMDPGAIAAFTSLAGNGYIAGDPRKVAEQWFVAGPAAVFAASHPAGFTSYTVGDPPFDPRALARFGARTYDILTKRLTWLGRPTYRLMTRARDGKAFSTGTAGLDAAGGAMVTTGTSFDDGQDFVHLELVVFHEMTHFWVGQVSDGGNWFSEGLTVYLTSTLPCEGKIIRSVACSEDLNSWLRNYYASSGLRWSQRRIEAAGFNPQTVRTVPYARGALYFAELNAALRQRSGGKRTLVDALEPLMAARSRGRPLTVARFEGMLRTELGARAVKDFRAKVIEGTASIEPPADAFGPCLTRTVQSFRGADGASVTGFLWQPIKPAMQGCDDGRD